MGGWRKVPLRAVANVEAASALVQAPGVVFLDIQGTLLSYAPSEEDIQDAKEHVRVLQASLPDGVRLVLTSNSGLRDAGVRELVSSSRVPAIPSARKPFPRRVLRSAGRQAPRLVIGDQPCTDGLLAWHLQIPFALVLPGSYPTPAWPRFLQLVGRCIRPFFFTEGEPLQ
jgi:predicted HAD superfamily phosphohydrolase YqeG